VPVPSLSNDKQETENDSSLQGVSEISLEKKTVIGDDEKKSLTKKFSYKSFFVFKITKMILVLRYHV
jgi:hypothetical protein